MFVLAVLNTLKIRVFQKAFLVYDFVAISRGLSTLSYRFFGIYILLAPFYYFFSELDLAFMLRLGLIFITIDYLNSRRLCRRYYRLTFFSLTFVWIALILNTFLANYSYYTTPKSLLAILPFLALGSDLKYRNALFIVTCFIGIYIYEARSLLLGSTLIAFSFLGNIKRHHQVLVLIFLGFLLSFFWVDISEKLFQKHEKSNGIRFLIFTTYFESVKTFADLLFGVTYTKWLQDIQRFAASGLLDRRLAENLNPHNFILDVLIRFGLSGIVTLLIVLRDRLQSLKVYQWAGLVSLMFTTVTGYERFLMSLFLVSIEDFKHE